MKIFNKNARFKYRILETLEAGIVLSGAEVKAIRENRIDLSESFARVQNGEVFLKNVKIFPPKAGFPVGFNPNHDHKLLLHKTQINSLIGKLSGKGMNLIPLSLYTTRNLIKVELALASPKTKYDKRRSIKAKDEQRRLNQEMKNIR